MTGNREEILNAKQMQTANKRKLENERKAAVKKKKSEWYQNKLAQREAFR